jgi:Predicted glycosyltransferases
MITKIKNSNFPLVFIIVLNWCGWKDTINCIKSLIDISYTNFHIVIVDNNSNDDSIFHIKSVFCELKIIKTDVNMGFSGGCNVGIRRALENQADYIWLLNNDTTVDPQALSAMVTLAEKDGHIGAVGSSIYYMDTPEKIQAWGGGSVSFWTGRTRHLLSPATEKKLHYLTASSILIRRSALEDIGFLDDKNFFMYWEDADFSFRLRKAGWKLAVADQSIVFHKEHASTGTKNSLLDCYYNESAIRFYKRHAPLPLWPIVIGTTGRLIKRVLEMNIPRILATIRGAWRGLTGPTEK